MLKDMRQADEWRRDEGLRRIGTVTGSIALSAVLGSGVVAAVVAYNTHTHSANTSSSSGAGQTGQSSSGQSNTGQLQPPAQAPGSTFQSPLTSSSGS
jgi:hypothetical protein